MIIAENIKKVYGEKTVLDIDSLTVSNKELIGLVGNNGAGKTTLLSLMLDLIEATEGLVKSKDVDVSKTEDWKTYTGSFLDQGFLIPYLNTQEFLKFIACLYNKTDEDVKVFLETYRDFFNEPEFSKTLIRSLSQGNKNKLGILAAIFTDPEILILDEPFANLDPTSQSYLKKLLTGLNNRGMTIIISSHDLNHVTDICSRILLIENGKILQDKSTGNSTLNELEAYFTV